MNATSTALLIVNKMNEYGVAVIVILGSFLTVALSMLVFRLGFSYIHRLATDQSLTIGGIYVRNLPYPGYKRFRSKKWNLEHMQ